MKNEDQNIDMPGRNQRLQELVDYFANGNVSEFIRLIEYSKHQNFNRLLGIDKRNGKYPSSIPIEILEHIKKNLKQANFNWLLTGEGEMLKSGENKTSMTDLTKTDNKLIPFYDDVISIGGSEIAASIEGSNHPAEYVDAGDWFKDATAAIRHYGDSMIEYPSGCILALREVQERHLVLWGKDYVIETKEYRVTKRIQRGKDEKHITAYSTDMGTYPDGRQIHEPIDIAWEDIGRIFFVLGYVVKKNGGTMVFSNSKK